MTTTSPSAPVSSAAALPARRRAAFGGLLLAEWTKIRSVRSTLWTLILFVVLTVGLTAGLTALVVASWGKRGSGGGEGAIIARSGRIHPRRRHRARSADDLRARRPR